MAEKSVMSAWTGRNVHTFGHAILLEEIKHVAAGIKSSDVATKASKPTCDLTAADGDFENRFAVAHAIQRKARGRKTRPRRRDPN